MNIKMQIMYVLFALLMVSHAQVWASCSITSTGKAPAEVSFTIPSLQVSSDAEPGTILYQDSLTSSTIKVKCTATGDIYQGYTVLTDADLISSISLDRVYATNIPGIGFRAGWGNDTDTPLSSGSLLYPWHIGSSKVKSSDGTYTIDLTAGVEIIVTGPVESGLLDTSRLVADWKYDNIVIGQLRFTSTSINVQANTCNLVEKNITVPLRLLSLGEFDKDTSAIVSDSGFQLQWEKCASGVHIYYKFTTSGSTGVTDGNILNIATDSGAAEGVGIQILDGNSKVLQFDQEYSAATTSSDGQSISVPLKAQYVKTGTLKSGEVKAIATFEVYYR